MKRELATKTKGTTSTYDLPSPYGTETVGSTFILSNNPFDLDTTDGNDASRTIPMSGKLSWVGRKKPRQLSRKLSEAILGPRKGLKVFP
jgi:hypothetical protein